MFILPNGGLNNPRGHGATPQILIALILTGDYRISTVCAHKYWWESHEV